MPLKVTNSLLQLGLLALAPIVVAAKPALAQGPAQPTEQSLEPTGRCRGSAIAGTIRQLPQQGSC